MTTRHFEPTPTWLHALAEPECGCHLLLVIDDDGEIAGWCRVFSDGSPGSGELAVGLLAANRGQGWGTRLLEQALAWAAAQGFHQVWLSTWPGNLSAALLFRKFGFRPNGTWQGREQVMVRFL